MGCIDDRDYAIELGEYLATAADNFLRASNYLKQAQETKVETVVQEASRIYSDTCKTLRLAVYEFRSMASRTNDKIQQTTLTNRQ